MCASADEKGFKHGANGTATMKKLEGDGTVNGLFISTCVHRHCCRDMHTARMLICVRLYEESWKWSNSVTAISPCHHNGRIEWIARTTERENHANRWTCQLGWQDAAWLAWLTCERQAGHASNCIASAVQSCVRIPLGGRCYRTSCHR